MESYYVINGNEYGVDLQSKKNFTNIEDAYDYYEKVKFDDFACLLIKINSDNSEKIILKFYDK